MPRLRCARLRLRRARHRPPQPPGSEALHRCSLALALTASLGGNGVAAFPHNSSRAIHNTMAALFFLGNLFHFWIETLLERHSHIGARAP